jgi:hypothetical protein
MSAWRFRPLGPVGLISFLVGLIVRCVRVLHDLPCSLNLALALVDQVSGTRQRVVDVLELLCTSGAVLGLTFIIGHRYHPGLALSINFCGGTLMADTRADQCRKNAEECRRQAGNSPKAVDKAVWLKMAEDWLKLAGRLDDGAAKGKRKPNSN